MSNREGIEIDYCPQCRGVWLDRGELDKIIERSVQAPAPRQPEPRQNEYRQSEYDARPREAHYDHDKREGHGYKKKKRESFLDDLFDFG
jgi:Zn-finger nucleic acid-binding protein